MHGAQEYARIRMQKIAGQFKERTIQIDYDVVVHLLESAYMAGSLAAFEMSTATAARIFEPDTKKPIRKVTIQ